MTNLSTLESEDQMSKYLDQMFWWWEQEKNYEILRIKDWKINYWDISVDKLEWVRIIFKTHLWQVTLKTDDEFKTIITTNEIMQGDKKAYIYDLWNEEVIEVDNNWKIIGEYIQNLIDVLGEVGKIDKKYVEVVYLEKTEEDKKQLFKAYLKLSQNIGWEYQGKWEDKKFRYRMNNPIEDWFRSQENQYKGRISQYLFNLEPKNYRLGTMIIDYPAFIKGKETPLPYKELMEDLKGVITIIKTQEKNKNDSMSKENETEF